MNTSAAQTWLRAPTESLSVKFGFYQNILVKNMENVNSLLGIPKTRIRVFAWIITLLSARPHSVLPRWLFWTFDFLHIKIKSKISGLLGIPIGLNRYRRKRPKVDASFFDSALSHTRRSDASEKKEKKILASTLVQIRLWRSFEYSLVSVKTH